jgi:hypothetical protein
MMARVAALAAVVVLAGTSDAAPAHFSRSGAKTPWADFARDGRTMTVTVYNNNFRDFAKRFSALQPLGIEDVTRVQLVFPIAACHFGTPDTEVHTCLVAPSDAKKVVVRFSHGPEGTKVATGESSNTLESLKTVKTFAVDPRGGNMTSAQWLLSISLYRVRVGDRESGPVIIELGGFDNR